MMSAPLPWTVADELRDFAVLDANGWILCRIATRFFTMPDGKDAKQLAEHIARCVNTHALFLDLVRRMYPFVQRVRNTLRVITKMNGQPIKHDLCIAELNKILADAGKALKEADYEKD